MADCKRKHVRRVRLSSCAITIAQAELMIGPVLESCMSQRPCKGISTAAGITPDISIFPWRQVMSRISGQQPLHPGRRGPKCSLSDSPRNQDASQASCDHQALRPRAPGCKQYAAHNLAHNSIPASKLLSLRRRFTYSAKGEMQLSIALCTCTGETRGALGLQTLTWPVRSNSSSPSGSEGPRYAAGSTRGLCMGDIQRLGLAWHGQTPSAPQDCMAHGKMLYLPAIGCIGPSCAGARTTM